MALKRPVRCRRWLSGDAERIKEIEKTMFQFGAGDHICLGKNIGAVEIYKLVPALMRSFEVRLLIMFFLVSFYSLDR